MLRTALNKTWKQHLTNKELYGKIHKITNYIRLQRLRFAGHSWRSKNELIGHVLLCQPLNGNISRVPKTYIDKLMEDTGCTHDDLSTAMNE